ncbi:MAG TPA: hypothetical protein VFF29_05685 [Bacteroidota bacterium]|nr:hypothetical protein [Bacteroidota bacterium]
MNHLQLLNELEELTQHLGVQLRYEKGDFEGGYCILKDQKILLINKRFHDAKKASTLAQALNDFGIDNIYIKPILRQFIEDEVAKASKVK